MKKTSKAKKIRRYAAAAGVDFSSPSGRLLLQIMKEFVALGTKLEGACRGTLQ